VSGVFNQQADGFLGATLNFRWEALEISLEGFGPKYFHVRLSSAQDVG
jgi:hypothetical protein